jgi:pseudouridine-5'-phosphate glycosidase
MNCEKIVRKSGVIPATIGVIEGKIMVGMTDKQLQFLANGRPTNLPVRHYFLHFIHLVL